jgi:K+-sensing histidine kinase KdpD
MDEDDTDRMFYLGAGPLAALVLGIGLIPLRGLTTASNFTFVFLALTIVVAEYGGRWPAVATALTSTLSLDFFLTAPYLRLTINEKNDVIAFLGLGVCGLLVALLGARRKEQLGARKQLSRQLDVLHSVLLQLQHVGPIEARLGEILDRARSAFPLRDAVVRNTKNGVIAAAGAFHAPPPVPGQILELETLRPPAEFALASPAGGWPLALVGGRIPLVVGGRQVGWLDIWGNGKDASEETRRLLSDFVRQVALLLVSVHPGLLSWSWVGGDDDPV